MTPLFTPKTLAFLRALKRHNEREWFHARKAQYEEHVREPMAECVERLALDFRRVAPELVADRKASMFRQWRDTRFSENKAPLKTNIAAVFPDRRLGRMQGAALYFEIAPTWVWMGGGIYAPDSAQLLAIREHVATQHRALDAIVAKPALRKIGGLQGKRLTRVPRGFDRDHPAARYLMHTQFLAAREEPAEFAIRPDFYKQLLATFTLLLPLCRFLNEPLLTRRAVTRRATLLDG